MKKRVVGGTSFFVLCFLSLLFDFFNYLCFLFVIIGVYEMIFLIKSSTNKKYSYMYLLFFLYAIYSLIVLYKNEHIYIFVLISGIMLNDTFAFFTGKKYGKRRLSKISPNKTIEGLFGGILCSMLVYIIYVFTFDRFFVTKYDNIPLLFQLIINTSTLFLASFGDLLESKLKRVSNAKDSGNIVYGHGGILDRVDSWLLSAIFFNLIITLFTGG